MKILRKLYDYWMTFAKVWGWVMNRIILSILFFLVFTPIAFFMKLLCRDPLCRKFEMEAESYWIKRQEKEIKKEDFEKQY